jgi:hypothetical protein
MGIPLMNIALYEFEVPVLASKNGFAKCQVRKMLGTLLVFIEFEGSAEWYGRRNLGAGWKIHWDNDGMERDLYIEEKASIDRHIQRIYRIRACL